MNNIIFWSDPHIAHKNIASKETSSWERGYRNFNSLEEHDDAIIENFNKVSDKDTTVFLLGDLTFKGQDTIKDILNKLVFKQIHWILGNHDGWAHKKLYVGNKDLHIIDYPQVMLHNYLETLMQDTEFNLTRFCLFHYPIGSWNGMYKGSIHLHGHSHGTYSDKGKMLDVGVDNAYKMFGEYRPFTLKEVVDYIDKQEIVFTDHHNEDTK